MAPLRGMLLLAGVVASCHALAPRSQPPKARRQAIATAIMQPIAAALVQPATAWAADVKSNKYSARIISRLERLLEDLQRDLYDEDWTLLATYIPTLRADVPIFTKYTDTAFPGDSAVDKNSRVALRYEVGRFYGAVERLKRAVDNQDVREAEAAYAAMSVAFDRYRKAGGLYNSYDPVTSTERFYANVDTTTLQFVPPAEEPPKIRDRVLLLGGPDKGRTGVLLGIDVQEVGRRLSSPDTQNLPRVVTKKGIVKLDTGLTGSREIKVVPLEVVAKTLGEDKAPSAKGPKLS